MSPTVFRQDQYRGFFFSREEVRPHVHVACADGEAKFWIEPAVSLAHHTAGLDAPRLHAMQQIVEERRDDILAAWHRHFAGS